MFGLGKLPFERRVFPLVWPPLKVISIAIPLDHPAMAHPVPLQATTAIASFSIAATLLFQMQPRDKAQSTATKLERLIFERIASDSNSYVIRDVLKLREEQEAWIKYVGCADLSVQATLDMILRVVNAARITQYEKECKKDILQVTRDVMRGGGFCPTGFLAKRWLSHISGREILHEDSLAEEGFDDLGLASHFFNIVMSGLLEGMKE